MTTTGGVLFHDELTIASEDDVVIVRTRARDLAAKLGFDQFALAALVTATSELARNALVHGGGGKAIVEGVERSGRRGVVLQFVDDGPGISDVERVLRGGFSTARSLGLGLAGSRRLADELTVDTTPGKGTRVAFTKWKRGG